jgi:hypothetical protein
VQLPEITYQSTYKWEDRVVLCIGSIDNILELESHLKNGEALVFDERDDSAVLVKHFEKGMRALGTVIIPTDSDLKEFASVCEGLQASPPPSTGYVLLSSGYTIALVTLD